MKRRIALLTFVALAGLVLSFGLKEASSKNCHAQHGDCPTTTTTTTTTPDPEPTPQPGYTFCAWEGGQCSFTGTKDVIYGANSSFTSPSQFTDGVFCDNTVFGDPIVFTFKHCEIRDPVVSNGTVPGVGVVKWGASHFSDLPNPERLAGCISSTGSQPGADTLPCQSLIYINHTNIVYGVGWNAGVGWQDMDNNNWWLRDAAGNKIRYGGDCNAGETNGEFLANLNSPGYRQAFINGVLPLLDQFSGLEGFYLDNVLADMPNYCYQTSSVFPTQASYQQGQIDFLAAVMPTLRARGYVNANVLQCCDNDGNLNIAWAQRAMPYLDADSMEYYAYVNGKTRIDGTAWDQQWTNWQRLIGVVQGMGKQFSPIVTWPSCSDFTVSTYIKASYLLEWNGTGYIIGSCPHYAAATDPTANWTAPWTKNVGTALGPKQQLSNGVWTRSFSDLSRSVYVNPTSTVQTLPDGRSLGSGMAFIG